MRQIALIMVCVMLSACGLSPFREAPEATLGDLEPVRLPENDQALPEVSLDQLADIYREVLRVTDDPRTRLQVLHRLADIEMLDGEARLATSEGQQDFFSVAIQSYETILAENPDNPVNDKLLYQLSKAYELNGQNEESLAVLERLSAGHPDSQHALEAEFRKAEVYFSEGQYARAEAAYARVIAGGDSSSYYTNSLYMHGWSRFKQGNYRQSISSYTETLDRLMPADNNLDELARGERELVQDCLRVLAVVFSYLEGAETIAAAYEQLGVRPYQHLLYQGLGDLYLSQQRYRDSAETYKDYTRRYPDSQLAHVFQIKVIEAYEAGGFPDLIVDEKRAYVAAFAIQTPYWQASSERAQGEITPQLKLFIDELASYYHALAQASAAQDSVSDARTHYLAAAGYYELYIESFPLDAQVPEMGFLLAESQFEAGDYRNAIDSYEWVAYQYSEYERAADAGYAAILAYEELESELGDASVELQRERIDSELMFASTFANDQRTEIVLGHAATALFELQDYGLAIIAAATLTHGDPKQEVLTPALLVIGHSFFELQMYPSAENAYADALEVMPRRDDRRDAIVERVAASIYKQAEALVAVGDNAAAAQQFERVMAAAPDSEIRVTAQFDAANNYVEAGALDSANRLFKDFRKRYPNHALSATVPAKLISNYEAMENWTAAAGELDQLMGAEPESEAGRQALYLSAEYYDRAGQAEMAIARYRDYAHKWQDPMAIRMEAMNRLSELYVLEGDGKKRRFWLNKIMLAQDTAGDQSTDRSVFLAAQASSVFASDRYQAFAAVKLKYPIKKSLKAKKKAMESVLEAYNRTNGYGVEQFSTLATYRIGKVYQQLSSDLLDSERPGNIDALALEQYEILLEEQAYPFEEKAISVYESNTRRSWSGVYDEWVQSSFTALGELMPARYMKSESHIGFSEDIH